MVTLENLKITPYHPILLLNEINVNKNWQFPINIQKSELIHCDSLYTFVVKNRESMLIEKSIYATLGHNMNQEIVKHEYLGKEKVIHDLKMIDGYNDGLIELTSDCYRRENDTNKIVKIIKE